MKKPIVINISHLVDKVIVVSDGNYIAEKVKTNLGEQIIKILLKAVNTATREPVEPSKKAKIVEFTDIKTFGDVCEAVGTTEEEFNDIFEGLGLDPDTLAYEKLKLVVRAINPQGWKADWDNSNQKKWYPWFCLSSGFGFDGSYYGYSASYTGSGSRLCFESEARSNHAGKIFTDLYKEFLTITNQQS